MNAEREQQLDAIVWRHTGKRFRECTPADLDAVIARLTEEAAEDRRRALAAELQIAAHQAHFDQYSTEGVGKAEQWANGGPTT